MADPFLGEIRAFPFSFAPHGWALCDGQLLPISQNTALFSLLGTTYGGDGKSTFALPDLQGRVPLGPGQGPGLSLRDLGEVGGSASVALLQSEMPAHGHQLKASTDAATVRRPGADRALATTAEGTGYAPVGAGPAATLAPSAAWVAGGDQPHNNLQPTLVFNYCIAMQGIFPQRP
jgi:microcystin-dependent protein